MIAKITHFSMLFVTLKKNTNFPRVISNIYKQHFINFEYHNNSMIQYLLDAFYPLQFGKKIRVLRQIV